MLCGSPHQLFSVVCDPRAPGFGQRSNEASRATKLARCVPIRWPPKKGGAQRGEVSPVTGE